MMKPWKNVILIIGFSVSLSQAFCDCLPINSQGAVVKTNQDALARLLKPLSTCPKDVLKLRSGLIEAGATIKTAFVNNRGFHNTRGSFSLFEMAIGRLKDGTVMESGDFFFGHFTAPGENNALELNQSPDQGNLMIELIAWDPQKEIFNFYELIGDGEFGKWFYRGDSKDILKDVRLLHLQPDPAKPQFGRTLRCAGCHISGGPIMKELAEPNNDWWKLSRKLPLGNWKPAPSLASILKGLVDADQLSAAVTKGTLKLDGSSKFRSAKKSLTLQEQLRPLFCSVEINLESDTTPLDSNLSQISIPSGFFTDLRLASDKITVGRADYVSALNQLKARFPETSRIDGDHAWVVPIKATSDILAIRTLVDQGLIHSEFVPDVLAVDFTNPVLSMRRCRLLRFLPTQAKEKWQEEFISQLKRSGDVHAIELSKNLTESDRSASFHRERATKFLRACIGRRADAAFVQDMVRVLFQRRAEVFASKISKNPMGQILEPGFRVIFPKPAVPSVPGSLQISEDCRVN